MATAVGSGAGVARLEVGAYTVPTDAPESDGTLEWSSTTCVVVEAHGGGEKGLGYTYGETAIATLIASKLAPVVEGRDALDVPAAWAAMRRELRNAGQPGVGAMAVSAIDCALWDLKARLLGVPLCSLLGGFHDRVPVYGSGGFTSYSDARLREQAEGWMADGIPRVKVKVGREPERDPHRLAVVRGVIGDQVELMVDANGAYTRRQALHWAARFADELGVAYFEEPVSSDDRRGLRQVRERAPAGMAIAAGEYNWSLFDAELLLAHEAVDIMQADVTRCSGITDLLRIGAVCQARGVPFSAHCAPALHAHPACAIEPLVHLEYFHDHVRVERLLLDGALSPAGGALMPDRSRPGHGLELRRADAERYRA